MKTTMFVCLCLAGSAPAAGSILVSQGPTTDPDDVGLGYYSHSSARPTRNFKHGDNFALAEQSDIERVTWWGASENLVHPDLTNFTSFTVEFFDASVGPTGGIKPGTLIASETFDIADTNVAATGRVGVDGMFEYRHDVSLASAVRLDAGSPYFIAISAAFIDPAGDAWSWQDADAHDGYAVSYDYNRTKWIALQETDAAFVLEGTLVPAPAGSIIVLGGLLAARRRRS